MKVPCSFIMTILDGTVNISYPIYIVVYLLPLASGVSPIFPLVVHQSDSLYI